MTNLRRIPIAVALASVVLSCGEGTVIQPNPFYDIRIQVAPVSLVLFPGNTVPLTATLSALPAGADSGVAWTSSDTSVAVVDDRGVVTARKIGNATIRATAVATSNASASVVVSVQRAPSPVLGVVVSPASATVTASTPLQLTATVQLANPNLPRDVIWRSSNSGLANVSSSGLVTAGCNQNGEATITALAVADTTVRGTSRITVTGGAQSVFAISSIKEHGTSTAVNLASVHGTIDVVVSVVSICTLAPTKIDLLLGGPNGETVVASQSFGAVLPPTITMTVNTAAPGPTGAPAYPNGAYTLRARATYTAGVQTATASVPVQIRN